MSLTPKRLIYASPARTPSIVCPADTVRCAQNPSTAPDSASSRTWVFAVAAYAVCWGISVFGIWLGWEVWFEYWRRWRLRELSLAERCQNSADGQLDLPLSLYIHLYLQLYTYLLPHSATLHSSSMSVPRPDAHLIRQIFCPRRLISLSRLFQVWRRYFLARVLL